MTRAMRELAQAGKAAFDVWEELYKRMAEAYEKDAFNRLKEAVEGLQAEANSRIRVTPDKCGLDNERYEAMAGPLEAVINGMGLKTPAQVLALCDMAYGQWGKVVVNTSSGCVAVREGGQFGRTMFTIKGEGPEWE